jgi:hypothetical protein
MDCLFLLVASVLADLPSGSPGMGRVAFTKYIAGA